jgi:hypothetical protein
MTSPKGEYVPCPMSTGRRTSVANGKLRINKDDPTTTRATCIGRPYGKDCDMCPNSEFDARFKSIGSTADYQWLDEIINRACAAVDVRVTRKIRSIEHCCPDHGDVIMVSYDFESNPSAVVDKTTLEQIYNMIMEASNAHGVPQEVIHVHARRHDPQGKTFDLRVGLKRI